MQQLTGIGLLVDWHQLMIFFFKILMNLVALAAFAFFASLGYAAVDTAHPEERMKKILGWIMLIVGCAIPAAMSHWFHF